MVIPDCYDCSVFISTASEGHNNDLGVQLAEMLAPMQEVETYIHTCTELKHTKGILEGLGRD